MTKLSIHDFTVTLDTRETGRTEGNPVVLHLDRDGQPRLTMPVGLGQAMWVCADDDYFTQGYRSTIARTIVELVAGEWTFELIARELGVSVAQAVRIHEESVAEAAEKARGLAKVGV